jgi:protein-L-isoaspartate(D-aspartate) O-methyltransferase
LVAASANYTAIMAHVVGPSGRVLAIEIDPPLASRARANLAHLAHVDVRTGDGTVCDMGERHAVFINVGITHPQRSWLEQLRPQGRLIFPLTATDIDNRHGSGGMLRVIREASGYAAHFISHVGIFPCLSGRDSDLNERLHKLFGAGAHIWQRVRSLRPEPHVPEDSCWLHTDEFCLSTTPLRSH